MHIKLISPTWPKLPHQTPFHLAPLGLTTVAALFPPEWEATLTDENVQELDLSDAPDAVFLSCLLTAQAPRAYEIADAYRARSIPVVLGGIHAGLCPDEAAGHADAVVACEAEAVWPALQRDLEAGTLQPLYRVDAFPDLAQVGPARRDLLDRSCYAVRSIPMFDLVQATRGCTYNCYPCCVPTLRGTEHRVRPVANVVEEMANVPNDRFFIVDNCLMQNRAYQLEFFAALKDLDIVWVAHPILDDDDILKLAYESGAWYIYQAVDRISDTIRDRIRKFHDYGIGVEATVLLGRDSHDKDFFKRMVDFLLELEVEVAEFTVLTPFPNLGLYRKLEKEGRILHRDWGRYNTANTVFQPKRMTPEELDAGYHWSWKAFYEENSQQSRMAALHLRAMARLREKKAE